MNNVYFVGQNNKTELKCWMTIVYKFVGWWQELKHSMVSGLFVWRVKIMINLRLWQVYQNSKGRIENNSAKAVGKNKNKNKNQGKIGKKKQKQNGITSIHRIT